MDGRVNRPAAFALSPALPPQKVVLQVDASRQTDYRRWLLLGLLLLAAALFNGSQRSVPLFDGYRIAELQSLRAEEEARGRRLRREITALTSPALIDQFAREQLHMVLPGPDDQIVLTRVVPSEPPPSSVVASR
jgi:cell division protein FtsL